MTAFDVDLNDPDIDALIKEAGFDVKLDVHTSSPVSVTSLILPSEVMTINEQRQLLGLKLLEGKDVLQTKQNQPLFQIFCNFCHNVHFWLTANKSIQGNIFSLRTIFLFPYPIVVLG